MEATLSHPPLSAFLSHSSASFLRRAPPLHRFFTLSLPPILLASRRLRVCYCGQGSDGGRVVARPSSELRRGISETSASSSREEDERLLSLRQIFSRPDVGIDAYIVPSQDAHQVRQIWQQDIQSMHGVLIESLLHC
jgi:Xaa-Pro aminopeptidase